MKFIDIHSHIDMCKDVEELIRNAKEKDVLIVAAGVDKKSNRELLKLKEKYPELQICLGVYPKHVLEQTSQELESELKFIEENKNKIVGISEVGLDLFESEEIIKQKKALGKFVELAKKLDKPIIIHSRKAELITIEFLEQFNYKKIIMHCFCGSMKLVKRIIDNDWNLSIPTSVKRAEQFQKVIEIVPTSQLFCETDSPYHHPDKKFPNEPANVIESYKKIAEIKGLSLEEVKKNIWENWEKII